MGASGGTSANQNQSANDAANQSQNNLSGFAGAGSNQNVQNVLGQFGSGGLSLQQALSQLGSSAQGPGGATNGSGQYSTTGAPTTSQVMNNLSGQMQTVTNPGATTVHQDTSGGTNLGAIDELFTNPETAGLVAQSQVASNPAYAGLFGAGGLQGQEESNYGSLMNNSNQATNNYNQAGQTLAGVTSNLGSDRQALSGNDPSYGLQASDLAAYGQASNALGRQSAQQNQGIAQALAARGLGSSNNGAAIGSYAGAYGNQNEALAGLQNQIAQQRIQTAQGLAQARNASDLQQQSNAQSQMANSASAANNYANSANAQGSAAGQLGDLGMNAYNSQIANNMAGANNDYNMLAGGAASAGQYQTNQQNLNNGQFQQAQATKTSAGGPLTGILSGLAGGVGGAMGASLGGGLGAALGGTTPAGQKTS